MHQLLQTKSSESKRTSRLVRNLKLTGRSRRERNTETRARRSRRRSKPRKVRRRNASQRRTSSRKKCSRTSLHEGKSMSKHIMRKCKVVNHVDKDTSSGTPISSRRRSSRTTPARLHRACTVERLNTSLEELTKNNTADLFTKHLDELRTQPLARKLKLRILDGMDGDEQDELRHCRQQAKTFR